MIMCYYKMKDLGGNPHSNILRSNLHPINLVDIHLIMGTITIIMIILIIIVMFHHDMKDLGVNNHSTKIFYKEITANFAIVKSFIEKTNSSVKITNSIVVKYFMKEEISYVETVDFVIVKYYVEETNFYVKKTNFVVIKSSMTITEKQLVPCNSSIKEIFLP